MIGVGLAYIVLRPASVGAHRTMEGSGDFWAATQAEFQREGQLAYSDRPAAVQAAMERMYDNDSHYSRFSALFVDHEPGLASGSMRIEITQSSAARTAAYSNDAGTGTPIEETQGSPASTLMYSPTADAYVVNPHPVPAPSLMPLSSVPLSLVQMEYGATSIYGVAAFQALTANLMLHPAALITGSFFTAKHVEVTGETTLADRAVWELHGTQISGAPYAPSRGDGWRMWVDKQSGIILRLEYYAGANMIGWAEFREVNIDGPDAGVGENLPPLSIPSTAQRLDGLQYSRAVRPPAPHRPTQQK